MSREDNERWEQRGERAYGSFTAHPWRWAAGALAVICALWIGGCALGFIGSWGEEGKRIVSPENVSEQYRAIIDDDEAMIAAAENACGASKNKQEKGADDPTLIEDPGLAYKATYRRIRVDYDRRQKNLFEAKLVGPKGYPQEAPTLEQRWRDLNLTCGPGQ